MIPGVDVISRAAPPPRTPPTDTGVTFIVGPTATGMTAASVTLVHSMTEYVALLGARTGGPVTYDAADVFFREGGSKLYISRTNPGTGLLEAAAGEGAAVTKAAKAIATAVGEEVPELQAADPTIAAALAAINADYGPGQVLIADPTLAAVAANQSALLAHCAANNRVGLCSCVDGTATALAAAGTALRSDTNARYGALFAPSAIVPGVTAGTTRTVPFSAVAAGIISRNDAVYSQDQPAAGQWGQTVYTLDLASRFTDTEYQTLNDAGVDMARVMYGGVRLYGFRSLVDPVATPAWKAFTWSRLNMAIVAQADAIGERYVFSVLDGRGHTLSAFGGDLSAMLGDFWAADALFGATPEEAFSVDVGPSVNTPTTIANGELHAVLTVRMSPFAEHVVIEIVKVASNEALPAIAA